MRNLTKKGGNIKDLIEVKLKNWKNNLIINGDKNKKIKKLKEILNQENIIVILFCNLEVINFLMI